MDQVVRNIHSQVFAW